MGAQRGSVRQVPGRLPAPLLLDSLQVHGTLVDGQGGYDQAVRAELLSVSAATIDRYLKTARAKDPLHGIGTTKPAAAA